MQEIKELARAIWRASSPEEISQITGSSLLGIGSKRCAVDVGEGLAVKLPWRERGLWENSAEAALWEWAPPELQKLLAPVHRLQHGALWQDRCRPVRIDDLRICQELARWGISDAAANLGLLQERIVCYDYAYFGEDLFQKISPGIAKNEQNGLLEI